MNISEEVLKAIKNGENISYLIEFTSSTQNIYLTTMDSDINIDGKTYKSGNFLNNLAIDNISNNDNIIINLTNYYDNNVFCIEKLLNSSAIIKILIKTFSTTIFKGFISQINIENDILSVHILSNIAKLTPSIGQLFSPICRECLGSEKCGVNLENYKSNGIITEIFSADSFAGTHQQTKATEIGYYKYGIISFLSGKLKGIDMQIKDENNGKIYLLQNTNLLAIGDEYDIFTGCDKTLLQCRKKFNNAVNFRGEPYINMSNEDNK